MNKSQFLNNLTEKLAAVNYSERQRFLNYCAEMIDDRMEDGMTEEEAVAALGDIDSLAQEAMEMATNTPSDKKKSSFIGDDISKLVQDAMDLASDALQSVFGTKNEHSTTAEFQSFSEEIRSVVFECEDASVHIDQSRLHPDHTAELEATLPEGSTYTQQLTDGCLHIVYMPGKKSGKNRIFQIGRARISVGPTFSLALAKSDLESITVKTNSGDVTVEDLCLSGPLQLSTDSGDSEVWRTEAHEMSIRSVSGDMTASNLSIRGAGSFITNSGDLELRESSFAGDLNVQSSSGDLTIAEINCASLIAKAASGDVEIAEISANGNASISTASGDLTIRELHCNADFTCHSASGDTEVEEINAGNAADISTTSGDLTIRRINSSGNLTCLTSSGDIEAEAFNVCGNLSLTSSNGELSAEEICCSGSFLAKTVSGDIEANDIKAIGKASLTAAHGSIRINSFSSRAEIKLATNSGDIEIESSHADGSLTIESSFGNISISDETECSTLSIQTSNGDVELNGPSASRASITTDLGNISGHFSGDDYHYTATSKDGEVSVPHSTGSKEVTLKTQSGDINIHQN